MNTDILFYDTETTGLPDFKSPHTAPGQPRICQLGAILKDRDFRVKAEINVIIRPDGWTIPEDASKIHGITQADAMKYGISIKGALALMKRLIPMAKLVVAHNIAFDDWMLKREVLAANCNDFPLKYERRCTLEMSTDYCKIPPTPKMVKAGFNTYKKPSMQEAYTHFYGRPFEGAHDAMADVRACADVYAAITNNLLPLPLLGETA